MKSGYKKPVGKKLSNAMPKVAPKPVKAGSSKGTPQMMRKGKC